MLSLRFGVITQGFKSEVRAMLLFMDQVNKLKARVYVMKC